MTVTEKLAALRAKMKEKGADILLIPSDDYHQSEYVGEYFKSRAYVSGFTGSAGTLAVTADEAKLFTDGRYFIQAERQLSGSTVDLMRVGTEGVPTPTEYVLSLLKDEKKGLKVLAFDGKCISADSCDALRSKLPEGASLMTDTDFVGLIWNDRPALPSSKIWKLDEKYTGKSHARKLADVRAVLKDKGCDTLVMSSLCDIAWLYNLRGNDVANTPVFLAYTVITDTDDLLFVNGNAVSEIKSELTAEGITVRPYGEFFSHLAGLSGKTVLLDKSAVSEAIVAALDGCRTVNEKNPTLAMKAKKNKTELDNLRLAHVADGLAVTKLMIELKYGSREFDELTVEKYLIGLRKECAERVGVTYTGESFNAICAFAANAAMAHYSATPESFSKVDKNGPVPMLLVDSGGQYLEGTTDITRTFILGSISDEIKTHYTLTAMGNLRLAGLKFLSGITGTSLDIICRQPLWEHLTDYRHGTGHGVGYLLSVHEGPNNFHYGRPSSKLEEGMVTTDEPGVYVEGSHGIRIENELVARNGEQNEYGQFMYFENITFCPIDLDGINPDLMDASDVRRLNEYHKEVYNVISPYLCSCDREKLAHLTREIG